MSESHISLGDRVVAWTPSTLDAESGKYRKGNIHVGTIDSSQWWLAYPKHVRGTEFRHSTGLATLAEIYSLFWFLVRDEKLPIKEVFDAFYTIPEVHYGAYNWVWREERKQEQQELGPQGCDPNQG